MKIRKKYVYLVYPLMLLQRFMFTFIPLIFWNKPPLQITFLIIQTLLYNIFLVSMRINSNYTIDLFQDLFNEIMLLLLYSFLYYFVDGGLIFGTPNFVSLQNRIMAVNNLSFAFDAIGIFIVLVNLYIIITKNIKWIYLYFVKY